MRDFWSQFKTPIVIIASFFIALFLYTKLAGPIPFYINSVNTTKTDLFSSSGTGEMASVPDEASISVGVTKSAPTVAEAQKQTNTAADKIITELKKLGLSNVDIKTTNYSVNPNYGNDLMFPSRGTQNGYTVIQNLDIKVKPIEKVNKVVDTVTAAGANLIGGVNFTFSDSLQKSLEQEATIKAVNDAKEKAQTLANAAGVRLGKVINVVSSNNNPRPEPIMMKASKSDQQEPTNITPGENTVTVSVTIYYETY